MHKKEVLFAVIGGVVGAVLATAIGGLMPLGAQNDNSTFDAITCRSLMVRNGDEFVRIDGDSIMANTDEGLVIIDGGIRVFNDGRSVMMEVGEQGGQIVVEGQVRGQRRKDGTFEITSFDGKQVKIGIGDHGGYVTASGNRGAAQIATNDDGGFISVYGKDDSKSVANISIDEEGGSVAVYGNDGQQKVGIGVNEYGNGAVSTWDKNGYRLATLK